MVNMSYPTLIKTWLYKNNIRILGTTAGGNHPGDFQSILYILINGLTSFSSNPWTVVGSSNSTVAALDGVNRWTSTSSIVFSSINSAHSWIVLKQTGISSNFQLLISCATSSFGTIGGISVSMSPSVGFTGGSTTTDPTATDIVTVNNNLCFTPIVSSAYVGYVLHIQMSDDGSCTRWQLFTGTSGTSNGAPTGYNSDLSSFAIFDVPQNPTTGWTNPCIGIWLGSDNIGNLNLLNAFYNSSSGIFAARSPSGIMPLAPTGEAFYTSSSVSLIKDNIIVPNEISTEYHLFPIGLVSTTVGSRGHHGYICDMWWGPTAYSSILNNPLYYSNGLLYPGRNSNNFAQIENLVIPWDGSIMKFTGS